MKRKERETMRNLNRLWIFVIIAFCSVCEVPRIQAQKGPIPGATAQSKNFAKATVLKVFSANSDDHRYVSYLVEWQKNEVVVSDPLGASEFQVGDTLQFIVQKIRLPGPQGQKFAILNFMVINPKLAEGKGGSPEK